MAIGDIDVLAEQLPEVFRTTPAQDWVDDWIVIPVEQPVSPAPDQLETIWFDQADREDSLSPTALWAGQIATPGITGSFPGSPVPWQRESKYPPPDALAFYLPFHYYYPDWWGIYLIVDGVLSFADFILHSSGGTLTSQEARVISRLFLYWHEAYHHAVECFATRLEVTHRTPLYRLGFEALYQKTVGSDDSAEEALANGKAFNELTAILRRRLFKGKPERIAAARTALTEYIEGSPPGYRRGVRVARRFKVHERQFAEQNHKEALSCFPEKDHDLWRMFSYAFAGVARRISRVNYIIHRSSPLVERLPASIRYVTHRDLIRRLQSLADIAFVRNSKGSHEIWQTPSGKRVTIPRHPGDLRKGTLAKIIKQAGLDMSIDEFLRA